MGQHPGLIIGLILKYVQSWVNGMKLRKICIFSVSLRGSAQKILGDLSDGRQLNYEELVSALSDKFAPPDQMDLYRTLLREQTESIPISA
jgi:hypothetical protein